MINFLFMLLGLLSPQYPFQELFYMSNIPYDSGRADTNQDGKIDSAFINSKDIIVIRFYESIDPNSVNVDTDILTTPWTSVVVKFKTTMYENDTLLLVSKKDSFPTGIGHRIIILPWSINPADGNSNRRLIDAIDIRFRVSNKKDKRNPHIINLLPKNGDTSTDCARIKLEFSEKMMSFRIHPMEGYPDIPNNYTIYSANDNVYAIVFKDQLKANTEYGIIIDPIGTKDVLGTTDLNGNLLVDIAGSKFPRQVEWTFTTPNCDDL